MPAPGRRLAPVRGGAEDITYLPCAAAATPSSSCLLGGTAEDVVNLLFAAVSTMASSRSGHVRGGLEAVSVYKYCSVINVVRIRIGFVYD